MHKEDFFSINNKKALITGGGSGIGLAVAKRFLSAGARVIIADINDASELASSIGASYVKMDVSNETSVQKAFKEAFDLVGKLDILLNNAGVSDLPGTLESGDVATWTKILNINVIGVMNGLKHGPKYMNDRGSIINTSSQAAFTKVVGMEPYAASKSAVISLTKSSAIELAERGIRVNAICPSNTKTPMMMNSEDADYSELMSKEFSPAGRAAETDDMVGVFHFLASQESKFVNGQSIIVDGGWTAGITDNLLNKIIGE